MTIFAVQGKDTEQEQDDGDVLIVRTRLAPWAHTGSGLGGAWRVARWWTRFAPLVDAAMSRDRPDVIHAHDGSGAYSGNRVWGPGKNCRMAERAARVLVADDDPHTREILSRFLAERGFDVATASDGELTLVEIEKFQPDVVLLDIRMPNMDGIECLQRIVNDGVDCGVIMISGEADTDQARETLQIGAADFIYKPFDLEYLETSLLAKLITMGRP